MPDHPPRPDGLRRTQAFLKQIIYGGNDGIVTTFAIVAGFAGASAEGTAQIGGLAVLVFGLANLFADAASMGLGEFLSTRSRRDLYVARHAAMVRSLAGEAGRTAARLRTILRDRGLPDADADEVGRRLSAHEGMSAEMILRFETGLADPRGDRPAVEGLATFLSFVAFGFVPLVPFFLLPAEGATVAWSAAATGGALVALGLLRWNATGEGFARSLGETVLVGATCAVVAFVVGRLVGGG